MKRFAAFILVVLLLFPVTLHADVAWEAPDEFIKLYRDECHAFPQSQCDYIALCDFYSYTSPIIPTQRIAISKGTALHIEWHYTDEFGHQWGLWGGYRDTFTSWIPMDAVSPVYGPVHYLEDHAASVHPYAGEMKRLLPTQEEADAVAKYRKQTNGGGGGGGNPPDKSVFDFPFYTSWHYPDAPDCYYNVWSPDIVPLQTLTDETNTTWVYAQHIQNPGYTFWVNITDPYARPDSNAPELPPPMQEPPTHLPVPGQEKLQRITAVSYFLPVLPAIAAVLGVVLLSAILIVLLQRRKVT